ncbi:DUF4350 domain-containing protein [Ornithinibacillus massiliensis]|uniref:DUF4350 domain-containing protein n=1 Tax=Ornithinibacillus massiliensis TaxID=1944633 RepID=A0ABS5M9Z1_9BACI|nr:DUF4350 domain-containing protein [Ornithinibacillus massiliensis]MBS3679110.1 DUF4350 domain-containing protein [Ornithinibacillus massiliensis]
MQKSITKAWGWLFVLLIIFIAISLVFGSNKLEEYPPYLSTSPSPTGVKGFYTYLNEKIDSVERWEESPSQLVEEENQLLLMVEPTLISEQAVMNEYVSFMEAGNTILLFKNNLEGMFGISTTYGMVEGETVIMEDASGSEYEATMNTQTRILPESNDEILLQDDLGVIAIKRSYGNGKLIAVNSPDWLTNHYILEANNLDVVLNLLGEEKWDEIRFDEYTHRSLKSQAMHDIYPIWLLVAAFQLIFFTLLWLLYKGKRFGPIRTPREEYVRFSDEHTTALAAWYKRGKAYMESLNSQADYLRLLLREKWGISYQKEWKDLEEVLAVKLPLVKDDEWTSFFSEIEAVLHRKNITKQEYLLWSKRMDRLRKEVEAE